MQEEKKEEKLTRPPMRPLRMSKWAKTEYQETYQPPGWNTCSGDESYGPDAEARKLRSVLGLDPKLTKVDYVSVAHEFLPAPPTKGGEGKQPKRPLTMVERIREREFQAAIEAGKMPPLTNLSTENRDSFVTQDLSRARSTPMLSERDQKRKEAQSLGVLALDPKHHHMKTSRTTKEECFRDWGQYLKREASREKPVSAMERIKERDCLAVLNAVERGKQTATKGGPSVVRPMTEYAMNFQGRQRDHSKDHNVVTKGLDDEDVATRGSLGTRVLHDVNAYWVDARKKRSVLGLKQHLRQIRQVTTTMEAYQDTSGYLRRSASMPKVLTMTEKINERDHKALMEKIERTRQEGMKSETRLY